MVIDELIVVLGLDPRQFNEGQREALDAFRRTQQAAESFGKNVEASSAKVADSFAIVRKGALGIVGAFVGGEVAGFIEHVIGMDAATGRWARTMDATVENLGTWQSMIRQVGGTAEDATSALSTMQNELNNVRQGGGLFSEGFGYLLNKIGGAQGKSADQIMRELNSYFRGEISAGRETPGSAATYLRRIPGMNEPMVQALLGDLGKLEEESKKVGTATKETAEAAQLLTQRFSLLAQTIERVAAGTIPLIDLLSKPINQWGKGDVSKIPEPEFEPGSFMDRVDTWLLGSYSQSARRKAASSSSSSGGRADAKDRESWIRSMAGMLGINPDDAMRVAKSEGFGSFKSAIPGETSYGDFQLHTGGGLGDVFRKQTGLDPTDPANERAMDEFALRWAATHGWGDFHGAGNTGMGQWQGIGARGAAGSRVSNSRSSSSTSTSTTNIGKVEVHTQATDADGIAADIGPAIKHSAITAPANTGLV